MSRQEGVVEWRVHRLVWRGRDVTSLSATNLSLPKCRSNKTVHNVEPWAVCSHACRDNGLFAG